MAGGPSGIQVGLNVEPPRVDPVRPAHRAFLGGAHNRGKVTPQYLEETLKPNTQHRHAYRCKVELGPFQPIYRDALDYLMLARLERIPARYTFQLSLDIPSRAFQMTGAYRDRYFTDNPGVQNRIYTPVDIIHYLHTTPLRVLPAEGAISDEFSVSPPRGPVVVLVIVLAVLAGIAGALIYLVRYPLYYRLTDHAGQARDYQERLYLGPLARRRPLVYKMAGGTEWHLGNFVRKSPFTFVFVPKDGVRVEDPFGNPLIPQSEPGRGVPGLTASAREAAPSHIVMEMRKRFTLKHEQAEAAIILERIRKAEWPG